VLLDVLEQVSPVNQVSPAESLVTNRPGIDEFVNSEASGAKKLRSFCDGKERTSFRRRGFSN
jgi:hypothetical protein